MGTAAGVQFLAQSFVSTSSLMPEWHHDNHLWQKKLLKAEAVVGVTPG